MPIIVKEPEGVNFERCPAGSHSAVCIGVYDIGDHIVSYQGVEKMKRKLIICWEIDEKITTGDYAGKRFVVSKEYNSYLHEKSSLRHDLESWRGRAFTEEELQGFDVEKVVGVPCLVHVIHEKSKNGYTYVKVSTVVSLPKSMSKITQETDWSNDQYPNWIKKKQIEGGIQDISIEEKKQQQTSQPDSQNSSITFDEDTYPDDGVPF
jgi:hypothetical protein